MFLLIQNPWLAFLVYQPYFKTSLLLQMHFLRDHKFVYFRKRKNEKSTIEQVRVLSDICLGTHYEESGS